MHSWIHTAVSSVYDGERKNHDTYVGFYTAQKNTYSYTRIYTSQQSRVEGQKVTYSERTQNMPRR